ncbi:hypothetical protein [Thiomicrospira sp. S5]|uniref:hypothetical protein n=1 Tax=Thiomicrospira sp. S5 TaxID=1803865 RepID=UPI000F8A0853|nr:hypothetical protein [Thiomicrospira sp. S5]AZR81810.1 hypothetical protein AYJ59_05645 [Thiomicrospira sp. S5]
MMMWRYGLLYFATVFAAGFILGTIRVLSLEPWLGVRYAELLEMPIMLAVVYFSARYWVIRAQAQPKPVNFFGMGWVALGMLLTLELTLVLGLRGLTVSEYLATRDWVSGSAYVVSLLVFAFLPKWLSLKST